MELALKYEARLMTILTALEANAAIVVGEPNYDCEIVDSLQLDVCVARVVV